MQNQILQKFPTMTKAKQDCIDISSESYTMISNLSIFTICRFHVLTKIDNMLLFVKNPRHLRTSNNIRRLMY